MTFQHFFPCFAVSKPVRISCQWSREGSTPAGTLGGLLSEYRHVIARQHGPQKSFGSGPFCSGQRVAFFIVPSVQCSLWMEFSEMIYKNVTWNGQG